MSHPSPPADLTPPARVFRHQHTVRFGDCDPAGVVYFPRFYDWFHQVMEAWFDDALDHRYAEVLERYGFPAVESRANFRKPCRMGEQITIELRVERLGRSSFTLGYRVLGPDGGLRATGETTCAMIGVRPGLDDHFRPVRIPSEMRARIAEFTQDDRSGSST